MGQIAVPRGAVIYLDANCIIYSVERVAPYHALLLPLWQSAKLGDCKLITSAFSLLETLVGPLKAGDTALESDFRRLLQGASDIKLVPISDAVLEEAAMLRALTMLKTPDAIHAATARLERCDLLVTNDPAFRHVQGMSVILLGDLLAP